MSRHFAIAEPSGGDNALFRQVVRHFAQAILLNKDSNKVEGVPENNPRSYLIAKRESQRGGTGRLHE